MLFTMDNNIINYAYAKIFASVKSVIYIRLSNTLGHLGLHSLKSYKLKQEIIVSHRLVSDTMLPLYPVSIMTITTQDKVI